MSPLVSVNETIEDTISLTKEEIAQFALLCRDSNPLHFDDAYAASTRFGGIIACGPQLASIMMGITASHFSRGKAMVGLEFTFKFPAPVRPGDQLALRWEVTDVQAKPKLEGAIATLAGRAKNQRDEVVITGIGKVLVVPRL